MLWAAAPLVDTCICSSAPVVKGFSNFLCPGPPKYDDPLAKIEWQLCILLNKNAFVLCENNKNHDKNTRGLQVYKGSI